MKAMANDARKEMLRTGKIKYDATAREVYKNEVDSLTSQMKLALMNAPRERQAQLAANSEVNAMRKSNPDMTSAEIRKKGQQALSRNRIRFDARRRPIEITPREWEAIQSGAISDSQLKSILRFADIDQVRAYATPRTVNELSEGKRARIRAMSNSGYTTSEIAEALGVSSSTVTKYKSA